MSSGDQRHFIQSRNRTKIELTLVANQAISKPNSPFIKMMQVHAGFDVADDQIVSVVNKNDLVITSDIPLAADVIDKGCVVLSPRGELYTQDNIHSLHDYLMW